MKNKRIVSCLIFLLFIFCQNVAASPVNILGQWNVIPAADWLNYSGSLLFFENQTPTENDLIFDIGGHFDWYRDGTYVGTELFSGSLNDNILNFAGYALIDPNFIGLATYYGEVSSDSNHILNGIWYPPTGHWEAERNIVPVPPSVWLLGVGLVGLVGLKMKHHSVPVLKA